MPCSDNTAIAVGTALADGPPHRSQRAGLPHWAPASDANVEARFWIGMQDAGRGQPPGEEAFHTLPFKPVTLTAAPKRMQPQPPDLAAERADRPAVAGHRVVLQMASYHARQPAPLLGDGQMATPA
jgi:hypothetical protein